MSPIPGFMMSSGGEPAPGGGFDPSDLFEAGDDWIWLDSTDITTLWQDTGATSQITTDGQTVLRWDDKSGNGYDFTQSTASAGPEYVDGADGISIDFDGVNDSLTIGSTDLFRDVAYGIVAITYRSAAGVNPGEDQLHFHVTQNGSIASRVIVRQRGTGPAPSDEPQSGGRRLDGGSFETVPTTESKFADEDVYIHHFRYADALLDVYRDNSLLHSTSYLSAGSTSDTSSDDSLIGERGNNTQYAEMAIIEIVAGGRDTEFTAQEISDLNDYMQAKI